MTKDTKQISDVLECVIDKAYEIIQWKIIAATDQRNAEDPFELVEGLPKGYMGFDHEILDSILSMVKPLLSTAQQTQKVKAETAKDIVKLIKEGKVTIHEAMSLMELVKMKTEIENKEIDNKIKHTIIDTLTQ